MPKFDYKTFLEMTGKGGGPIQALGTAYGMPSCLINLGADALGMLPTPVLNALRGSTANGANRADDVIKAASAKLRWLTGIIEYDTEDGTFRFVSDSSKNGIDKDEGSILGDVGAFVGAMAGFTGRLYNNYQTTKAQIDSIKECLETFNDFLGYSGSNSIDKRLELAGVSPAKYQELLDQQYGIEKEDIRDALRFKLSCLEMMKKIDQEIAARLSNPTLEPVFASEYIGIVSGTNLKYETPSQPQKKKEIFRLSFKPPVSKKGKFILSKDGLYYDSQIDGIIPALLELEAKAANTVKNESWKLEHDPNIGGRGTSLTSQDLKSYVKTILDPNIVDDSGFLQAYYSQDNLLLDLIGQKNRKIYDVSAQIQSYILSGMSQVLISNLRQVMLSETSQYLDKINKRKKQIELAVKIPSIYGSISNISYTPGNVPINDFSYLEGINFDVDLQRQRGLVIDQADVSSVVLPLAVKFTKQIDNSEDISLDHLLISNIGLGSIVSNDSGDNNQSLSITTSVVSDGLIALYNYLSVGIESPSGSDWLLHNSSDKGDRLNGQLVGINSNDLFDLGAGIVYLDGITRHDISDPVTPSGLGSYVRLPNQPEFQDLLYSSKGCTIDTWMHIPELDGENYGFGVDYDISGLYRIILANENMGLASGVAPQDDILRMRNQDGTTTVKGFLFGITRDRRITQDLPPSNNSHDNQIEYASLFIAPTQSYDNSSIGFISRSYDNSNNCYTDNGWYNMKFPLWNSIDGVSLSSAGREFIHVALTMSPEENAIKMYCDGTLLATSSYMNVFGISNPNSQAVDIPSLKKNNSFEYNVSSMSSIDSEELNAGPRLDPHFTPWILGGGYTDGNLNGNFMGGTYGGIISGLKGYLGSTKFYSRALTSEEIASNYNANREFFKNIDVPNEMWEPILVE
jgi:hypothetical protein